MEAASRPPLEALPDLPMDEPLESGKARKEPAAAARDAAATPDAAAATPAESAKPRDPEQTGLNFIDPEMFLAPGQASTAVPVVNASEQSAKAPEAPLELTLEDPVVDAMLSAPPPPPAAPVATPAPAAAPAAKAESAAEAAAARAAARVPIAKTASLTAAATKLAAASGAATSGAKTAPARKSDAPATTAKTAARGESTAKPVSAKPASTASAPSAASTASAPAPASPASMTKSDTAAPKLDAPSLASWASARAAAAQKVRPATAPAAAPSASPSGASAAKATAQRGASSPAAAPSPPLTPIQASAPAQSAVSPTVPATTSAVPPAPVMDRDFIARNQVVERYLSGRLPLKAATEFERFCRDHAELLDEIGLPERVNAGLRLLEASGKPEPWQEAPRPVWQKPQVTLALAVAVVVLVLTLAGLAASGSSKSHRIAELQKQNSERALDPATSTREVRLLPSRSGASNAPAIIIGGGAVQLVDFKIDESRSAYRSFRVTIDRIDQGRVAVISNLDKDSNGHLRIALNSSALGPGNYQLTLEGLDWRGQPQPDSWVTIGIQR